MTRTKRDIALPFGCLDVPSPPPLPPTPTTDNTTHLALRPSRTSLPHAAGILIPSRSAKKRKKTYLPYFTKKTCVSHMNSLAYLLFTFTLHVPHTEEELPYHLFLGRVPCCLAYAPLCHLPHWTGRAGDSLTRRQPPTAWRAKRIAACWGGLAIRFVSP